MPSQSHRNRDGDPEIVSPVAIAAAVCATLASWYVLAYGDCIQQFFHFDDFWLLGSANRLAIHRVSDLRHLFLPGPASALFYRPLSQVGYFWLLERLFAFDASPYHAVQLGFHVANAALVFAIASTILGSRRAALATALLYAAAPGHIMAIYWLAAFSMTGTAFWYFACLLAWLRLRGWRRQVACCTLFGIALANGEAAVTIPVALTLTLLVEPRTRPSTGVRDFVAVYAIGAIYSAAKLWYFWRGIAMEFPSFMARTYVINGYGLRFGPAAGLQTVGYYAACSLTWLYWAVGNAGMMYALGFLILGALAAAALWARRSASGRVVFFGLSLFLVALGPALALPQHRFMYLVGVAAFGSSLAIVAAARAVPRLGRPLAIGLVAATLAFAVSVTSPLVRRSGDFRFMQDFEATAAGWLQAVQRRAQLQGTATEVVVPKSVITDYVFGFAHGQRLFYAAKYAVRRVDAAKLPAPSPSRVVVADAPPWRRGTPLPGQRPRWDWLRRVARLCLRNIWHSELAAAGPPSS